MEQNNSFGSIQQKDVFFNCGPLKLAGTLHLPSSFPKAAVVGCHGMLANRMSAKQISLARACVESEIAYLRFDHRGCGNSGGIISLTTLLQDRCEDLRAALDYIRNLFEPDLSIGLFGSSFGGTVALKVAAENKIDPIVALAAPVRIDGISQEAISELQRQNMDFSPDDVAGFSFDISSFIQQVSGILVIHGGLDEVVPVSNAHFIYNEAREPRQLVIMQDSDHAFSETLWQKRIVELAYHWLSTHLLAV